MMMRRHNKLYIVASAAEVRSSVDVFYDTSLRRCDSTRSRSSQC